MNYSFTTKNREYLRKRVANMDQLAYVRESVLSDGRGKGCRIAEVGNSGGLNFCVNLDRGMDIMHASCKGVPLAWISQNGFVNPAFFEPEGEKWLRTWGGGLLTGCGMKNVGGPNTAGGEEYGLHGRLSHLPAENVRIDKQWIGGKYVMTITGQVRQSSVFAENLLLTRTITSVFGESVLTVSDTVENQSFRTMPLMLLYHMNFGFPIVSDNSRLKAVKHSIIPLNDAGRDGLEKWNEMESPIPDYQPQVLAHEIPADKDGMAAITLKNPKLGLAVKLEYGVDALPYLIQWKRMDCDEFVTGLEPANCFPNGQTAERERGALREIAPGEVVTTKIKVSVIEL